MSWEGQPDSSFRVRRGGEVVADVSGHEWVDTTAQFGQKYEYSLQAVVMSDPVRAESEISPAVAITPQDRFPPAVPKGLNGMAASSSIELAWDPNGESDLGGYNVYDWNYRRDRSSIWPEQDMRNLLQPYPPDNTVVTWCPMHRDTAPTSAADLGDIKGGDQDLVLWVDGSVNRMPSRYDQYKAEQPQ